MDVLQSKRPRLFMRNPLINTSLKLSIQNFGPISSGDVELKPLTIFIGPNNSGKSYLALLIHSIIGAESTLPTLHRRHIFRYIHHDDYFTDEIDKLLSRKKSFIIPNKLICKLIEDSLFDLTKNQIPDAIDRNFLSEHEKLIRIGTKKSRLKIHTNTIKADVSFSSNKPEISNIKYPPLKIKINLNQKLENPKHDVNYEFQHSFQNNTIVINMPPLPEQLLREDIFDAISFSVSRYFEGRIATNSFYFPASRSGMLQGHKAISASIVKNACYGGMENLEIPKLSGVASDFISSILDLPNSLGPFAKDAAELEKEILEGEIKTETQNHDPTSEIKYRYKKQDIPLYRTSSIVSELTPLILYLKYLVVRGDLLVIEGPEAHLHPDNQRLFAKFLVRLIRRGLKIVITTHSQFMLEQLSNFVQVGKHARKNRIKLGFEKDDYLKIDEVSAYGFEQSSAGCNIVDPLKVSEKEGISQEEFTKTSLSLYDELLKIQDQDSSD